MIFSRSLQTCGRIRRHRMLPIAGNSVASLLRSTKRARVKYQGSQASVRCWENVMTVFYRLVSCGPWTIECAKIGRPGQSPYGLIRSMLFWFHDRLCRHLYFLDQRVELLSGTILHVSLVIIIPWDGRRCYNRRFYELHRVICARILVLELIYLIILLAK